MVAGTVDGARRSGGSLIAPSGGNDELICGAGWLLIVDDDADIQDVIVDALAGINCHVLRAGNGREALALLSSLDPPPRPFVVISDVNMPEMNGPELAAAIRADRRYDAVQVILLSSLPTVSHVADAFLRKPFELADLKREVERLLQKSAALAP